MAGLAVVEVKLIRLCKKGRFLQMRKKRGGGSEYYEQPKKGSKGNRAVETRKSTL
jgi:hypothetical protein